MASVAFALDIYLAGLALISFGSHGEVQEHGDERNRA